MYTRLDGIAIRLDDIDQRLQADERARIGDRASDIARLAAMEKDLVNHKNDDAPKWAAVDELRKEVKELREIVHSLVYSNNLLKWFSGIVGGAVIVWVVSQIVELL